MANNFIQCFSAEWIKKRRSFSSWLVIAGASFTPLIFTCMYIFYPKQLLALHRSGNFWKAHFLRSWEMMSIILLPMGIVLAVTLITQLEFKNNTWKQLHTAPVSFSSIYFSKLAVIVLMLVQLFLLFNMAIYVSVVIPAIFHSNIPFPAYALDTGYFLNQNMHFFIASLPLVSIQFFISLHFKNLIIPVASGLALVVGGLVAHSWKYVYMIPSTYTSLHFGEMATGKAFQQDLTIWSFGYFILFLVIGYVLYIAKKEKG